MLDDPNFLAAAARAQEEINARLKTEKCQHGQKKFDEKGSPTPCPACQAAAREKASGFWHRAKDYMDGVKPLDENGPGPKNTSFNETPGFDAADPQERKASGPAS